MYPRACLWRLCRFRAGLCGAGRLPLLRGLQLDQSALEHLDRQLPRFRCPGLRVSHRRGHSRDGALIARARPNLPNRASRWGHVRSHYHSESCGYPDPPAGRRALTATDRDVGGKLRDEAKLAIDPVAGTMPAGRRRFEAQGCSLQTTPVAVIDRRRLLLAVGVISSPADLYRRDWYARQTPGLARPSARTHSWRCFGAWSRRAA